MANRSIQTKILKMKRRNRYARLSGGDSKLTTKAGPVPFTEDAQGKTTTLTAVRVLVGEVSLSKQVINTGRGPSSERMVEYYARVTANSFLTEFEDRISELTVKYFAGTVHRIVIFKDRLGSIELMCQGEKCFFIEIEDNVITRHSRVYDKRNSAIDRYNNQRIAWLSQP